MAIQKQLLKFKGTIGNLSFYPSKYGDIVRQKGGPTATQIRNSPAFKDTRKNNSEFKQAGKAAKLIRQAFDLEKTGRYRHMSTDHLMTARLVKRCRDIVISDTTHSHGRRQIISEQLHLLKGFQFNTDCQISPSFLNAIEINIDRLFGTVDINLAKANMRGVLTPPEHATHFTLIFTAAALDFKKEKSSTAIFRDGLFQLNEPFTPPEFNALLKMENDAVIVTLEIQFHQFMNGRYYRCTSEIHNGMAIVAIDVTTLQRKKPHRRSKPSK